MNPSGSANASLHGNTLPKTIYFRSKSPLTNLIDAMRAQHLVTELGSDNKKLCSETGIRKI